MSAGATDWLAPGRDELAVTRILDAAGALFAEHGVATVGMAEIAAAAGCSRATLYRYFPNRHDLRLAFVQREARQLGAQVLRTVSRIDDPAKRLERAVLAAVDGVRSNPMLAVWFDPEVAGVSAGLAAASGVVETLAAGFLGDARDRATRDAAAWVVRCVVSLLVVPGGSAAAERRLVRTFLVPVVVP